MVEKPRHTRTHAYTYTYTCMCIYMRVQAYLLLSIWTYIHMYIYNLTESIRVLHIYIYEHLLYNHCHCRVDKIESFSSRFLFFVKFLVSTLLVQVCVVFVEKRKISYFSLARNLIRHLISPNQDDLSYSSRTFHFRSTNRVSCQTQPLWLENADQCRRHTDRSSIAMLFSWSTPPSADISLRL